MGQKVERDYRYVNFEVLGVKSRCMAWCLSVMYNTKA